MKKNIQGLFLLLLFVLSFNTQAQQVGSLWLNGAVGLNSNWILNQNAYGNQEMEYAISFGLTGGLGVNYFISRKWGMSGSAFLTQAGQNYSGEQGGAMATRKIKSTYLEVPVLVMRKFKHMRYPTWISAGPDFMILTKVRQEYRRVEGGIQLPNEEGMIEGDIRERFNPVNIALNVSLSRMVETNYLKSKMLLFSLNSSFSLHDINSAQWKIPNTHNIYQPSHNFYIGAKISLMFKVARMGVSGW